MKIIENTDGSFKKKQRDKIGHFIKMCKYDLLPSTLVGGITTTLFADIYSSSGVYDAFLFGGVSALALTLAINTTIVGIKYSKNDKKEIIDEINNNFSNKGKGRN